MSRKILCVEDNPQNMRLVRKMLGAEGYSIIEAVNGLTALKIAAEEMPDLILMDINLPDIDGMEATRSATFCRPVWSMSLRVRVWTGSAPSA